MLVWWGVAGLVLGVVAGRMGVRRAHAGETWDDWLDASPGPLGLLLQALALGAVLAALTVPGIPGEARALVIAGFVGICGAYFGEGIRRRLFAYTPDPPDLAVRDVGRVGRWLGKDLPAQARPREFPPSPLAMSVAAAGCVGVGALLGLRGEELIPMPFLGVWVAAVHALREQITESGAVRRELRRRRLANGE